MAYSEKNLDPLTAQAAEQVAYAVNKLSAQHRTRLWPHQIPRGAVLAAALIVVFALWLRAPLINHGLPYLYDEDEGHHFNRVVQMLKTGDYNPHYFLKPALHFYLRLPVTAVAFLKSVERGEARQLDEIKTTNRFGLAGYEFTSSHPILVKYNRAFSLLIALGVIICVIILAHRFGQAKVGVLAALFLALSPAHFSMSTHIGVDMLMAFFVICSLTLSVSLYRAGQLGDFVLASFTAGLAVASKYNAFFIVLVPLLAFVGLSARSRGKNPEATGLMALASRPITGSVLCVAIAGAGFLLGAPYSVLDLPAFLNGAAFEVWHYKLSHPAPAGWAQAAFYGRWFATNALGWGIMTLSVIGFISSFLTSRNKFFPVLFALFPLSYFAYMSSQQLNFTRNMIVLLPFVSLYAAFGVFELLRQGRLLRYATIALLIWAIYWPLQTSLASRNRLSEVRDSRNEIVVLLAKPEFEQKSITVAGDLLMPHSFRAKPGVSQFSSKRLSITETSAENAATFGILWDKGADYVVLPAFDVEQKLNVERVTRIGGELAPQRIIQNPAIDVLRFAPFDVIAGPRAFRSQFESGAVKPADSFNPSSDEGLEHGWSDVETHTRLEQKRTYRWMSGRYASFVISSNGAPLQTVKFTAFSPWLDQSLTVYINGSLVGSVDLLDRTWSDYLLSVPQKAELRSIEGPYHVELVAARAGVPARHGISADSRQLAIAFENIQLFAGAHN